jgi:hypothetical protein
MRIRFAALAIVAASLFAAIPARAFDATGYHGETALEIMVTGDTATILAADPDVKNRIEFYAMSLAGKLQFLWSDRLPINFSNLAMMKTMLIAPTLNLDTEDQNNLLKLGSLDAIRFAEQFSFDSPEAQHLIASLTTLIND